MFDVYMRWRVGGEPPEVPEVVFVRDPSDEGVRMDLKDLPRPAAGRVRIVIISDTHECHRQVTLPRGDVLLHCGDILMSSSLATKERGLRVLQDFNDWLEATPCKERVVIGGNHDVALESLERYAAEELFSAAVLLQDSAVVLPHAGIKVYGNAFSHGHSHNMAWQAEEPEVSDACVGADVVMTHHATSSVVDEVLRMTTPRLWASGHAHAHHGTRLRDGLLFVNAAVLDEHYRPVQPPVVVDLPRRR